MLKKVTILMTLVAFAAVLALAYRASQPAHAVAGSDVWDEATFSQASVESQKADLFTGVIVKQDGQFVLQSGGTAYRLDNQSAAAQFEGKRVRVRGTLDSSTNTIKVEGIEPL